MRKKLSGKVIKGKLEGQKIGFPTANIYFEPGFKSGIYAGRVQHLKQEYLSAIYIDPNEKIIEAHLLNFKGDLYNQILEISIEKKIRDHQVFPEYDTLISQIQKDIQAVKNFYRGK